ncbi:MAG TPA: cytochrome C [Usitatibacter sp.]|nr:cytochrome C [Usitatibacter sp.]
MIGTRATVAPRHLHLAALVLLAALLLAATQARAIPVFNRQTGQNCMACHAGGQFPELTAYGRLFKLTGYTIGERALPLAMMAVASYNKTKSTTSADPEFDSPANFPKDGNLIFQTASAFLGGKITNNLGAFAQFTYENYDHQSASDSHWIGHTVSDNLDVRYVDRFIQPGRDLIVGATMNNNPGVQDVWNSIPAWGYNVVPGSSGPATTPIIAGGLAQNVAGFGAYAYWNRTIYAELSGYRTANGVWSFMSQGFDAERGDQAIVKGTSPYWRLAFTHDWGPHSAMLGTFGLDTKVYPDPTDPTGSTSHYRDVGVDGQYQYILDPHAVTVTASYIHEHVDYADSLANQPAPLDPDGSLGLAPTNASDTLKIFRAKASYVYDARYGGTLSYFDVTGTSNSALQTSAYDPANPGTLLDGSEGVTGNLTGNPGTSGWTIEGFWTPVQYLRVGLQYTMFNRFNGASSNYDGFGRSAKDNDTLFAYAWVAF